MIPALNEAHQLPGLFDSLQAAGIPAAWTWVADGGSSDGTRALLRRRGIHQVVSPRGRGPQLHAGALAAMESRPDLLFFVHADSRVPAGLANELKAAFGDPGLGYACLSSSILSPRWPYRLIEWVIGLRTRLTRVPYGELGLLVRPGLYRWTDGYPPWPLFEEIRLAGLLRGCAGFRQLKPPLGTSARRWEEGGPALVTLRNWGIMALYLLGVSPATLARFYSVAKPPTRKI